MLVVCQKKPFYIGDVEVDASSKQDFIFILLNRRKLAESTYINADITVNDLYEVIDPLIASKSEFHQS